VENSDCAAANINKRNLLPPHSWCCTACLHHPLQNEDNSNYYRLVGWSLTSLFSTNTAISETKGQGWRVILLPSEGRLAIY